MSKYIIATDVACDLPQAMVDKMGVDVASLTFLLKGKEYMGTLDDRVISKQEIYDELRNGEVITTSAVNVYEATRVIKAALEAGKDVLCLMISSGLSSTYANTLTAANELKIKYPQRKIEVIDTLCGSLGQGLLVCLAVKLQEEGKSLEEVRDFIENIKLRVIHWFTVEDLHFLQRGGRVSKTVAFIGSALKIKPILKVDDDGRLISISKARGRLNSLITLADNVAKGIVEPNEQTIFISHGDCLADAETLAGLVNERVKVKEIIINTCGPVIGAHAGPGTMAIFYLGTKR